MPTGVRHAAASRLQVSRRAPPTAALLTCTTATSASSSAALTAAAGIDGCKFVHASGFIGGNATYEGALAMALRLVAAFFTLLAINQGWQLAKSVYDLVTRERDEYEFDM